MGKVWLVLSLVLLGFFAFAQESPKSLEELQKAIDELQYGVVSADSLEYRQLDEQIKVLKITHDSLVLQHDLLKIELLLNQTKLAACNDGRNSLEEVLESERAMFYTKVKLDENNNVSESSLKKGNYIVLVAVKTYAKAQKYLSETKKNYPKTKFIVAQNSRKTWFHVCIDESFDKEESGSKVSKARQNGFEKAWAILLN